MTQCLSSRDPTEKSSISHSYVSMSSSEDAGVGHSGDLHWASGPALELQLGAKCICDGRASSHEGLHVPQPRVPCTSDEPVLPSTSAVWRYHLGWYLPLLLAVEVPYWWRVWLGYPFDADCFLGFWSFGAILPELPCGVWSIRALPPLNDSLDLWFIFFFCNSPSRTTPSSWSWIYSYLCCAPWTWTCSRRRIWQCCFRWFREWIPFIWWVMWWLHAEPSTMIAFFVCSYKVIILLYSMLGL